MSTLPLIYVVDDDPTISMLISGILESDYRVQCFDSSVACLNALENRENQQPDAFLLDVHMPEIDGYALCRQIREISSVAKVPVIFISAKDTLNDVLAGYEAGAQDYLPKTFEPLVLHKKLATLLKIAEEKSVLQTQADNSDFLATVFMTNLDEYAVLIRYLRALNESHSCAEIAEHTLTVLNSYRLKGAFQIRLRDTDFTFGQNGPNHPMEMAIIKHLRTQGRIFEFKTRSVYNFEHITVLVTNMPVDDPDLCGRIRDNLAIVAESANAKVIAQQAIEDKLALRGDILQVIRAMESLVGGYAEQFKEARFNSTIHTTQLVDQLIKMVAHLGLTTRQEDDLVELVREKSETLVELFNFTGERSDEMALVQEKLSRMLGLTQTE